MTTYDPPLPALAVARATGDAGLGKMATYVIHAAQRLGVLDALAERSWTLNGLAERLGVDRGGLSRLLTVLVCLDVVSRAGADRFALGPMAPFAGGGGIGEVEPNNPVELGWVALSDAVRDGKPSFDRVHGMSLFEYLEDRPEVARRFQERMRMRGDTRNAAVADVCRIPNGASIVDVGGGTGRLLAAFLARNPDARGVLVDSPATIAQAREQLDPEISRRFRFQPANMFDAVPAGGDVYLLSSILHDWNDATAVRVLRAVRAGIASGGQLLIVEQIVPERGVGIAIAMLDLEMLALTGGKERTLSQYRSLLSAAGFSSPAVLATSSPYSVLRSWPSPRPSDPSTGPA